MKQHRLVRYADSVVRICAGLSCADDPSNIDGTEDAGFPLSVLTSTGFDRKAWAEALYNLEHDIKVERDVDYF